MGNLLASVFSSNYPQDVFLDFEGAQPTPGEQKLFDEVTQLLQDGEALITEIQDYKGCGALSKAAISKETPDAESKCFEALLRSVAKIYMFYQYAERLKDVFPRLIVDICTSNSEGKETLAQKQALAKQVGALFNFVLRFDTLRMMTPDLSNDFSYYRRMLGSFSNHPDIVVDSDTASSMGMFTAEHIPMMSALSTSGGRAATDNPKVVMALALMANSCRTMITNNTYSNEETNLFCARTMTGAIVLYDHIADLGVFHKKSQVQLKGCVQLLKTKFKQEGGLLNAVHYSTRNFRTAPASMQNLFN